MEVPKRFRSMPLHSCLPFLPDFPLQGMYCIAPEASAHLPCFFPPACPSTLYCNLVGQTDILHLHCLASGGHAMVGVLK